MIKLFIQAKDFHVWRIITNGDLKVPNDVDEWEYDDKKKSQLKAKAMHLSFVHYSLTSSTG
ncbi:hypothetical protein Goari_019650 [Gossypium aridum]|uniref:Uncharacterized protein n=1 Tax=Gossypium aridum TaxID=34290 RepID=A0A7J8WTG3_GOSAI|nr:hypothetical protein [Gossypium aridum]